MCLSSGHSHCWGRCSVCAGSVQFLLQSSNIAPWHTLASSVVVPQLERGKITEQLSLQAQPILTVYGNVPKILQHEIYVVQLCRYSLFHDVIPWCIKSFTCWSFFLGSSAVFTRHCPQTSRDMPGDSHWSFNKSSRMFTLQSSGFDPTKSCGMKIKRCKFFPSESSWNVHVVWAIEIVRD